MISSLTTDIIPGIDLFADSSRVWIYQSSRAFTPQEAEEMQLLTSQFAAQWTAHSHQLKATGAVLYERFVVLLVDENQANASGCSIDSSVHFIRQLETKYGLSLFDRTTLCYRHNGMLKTCSLQDIRRMLAQGELEAGTTVFNNLVQSKKDFLTAWEIPLQQSWAARYLA